MSGWVGHYIYGVFHLRGIHTRDNPHNPATDKALTDPEAMGPNSPKQASKTQLNPNPTSEPMTM